MVDTFNFTDYEVGDDIELQFKEIGHELPENQRVDRVTTDQFDATVVKPAPLPTKMIVEYGRGNRFTLTKDSVNADSVSMLDNNSAFPSTVGTNVRVVDSTGESCGTNESDVQTDSRHFDEELKVTTDRDIDVRDDLTVSGIDINTELSDTSDESETTSLDEIEYEFEGSFTPLDDDDTQDSKTANSEDEEHTSAHPSGESITPTKPFFPHINQWEIRLDEDSDFNSVTVSCEDGELDIQIDVEKPAEDDSDPNINIDVNETSELREIKSNIVVGDDDTKLDAIRHPDLDTPEPTIENYPEFFDEDSIQCSFRDVEELDNVEIDADELVAELEDNE